MLHTHKTLRLAAVALTAVAVLGLTACSNDNDVPSMPGMDHGSNSASAAPSTTASPASGPHNMDDVMFAQMMVPHHEQAIAMSDMLLAKDGIDAEVSELAGQIKAAQAPEIATMSGWLAGWGQHPSPSMGMDHDMGGMMSQADMDALEKASGADAARLFLTGMIAHHQGAITMAKDEVANGQNPEAKQLAQNILDAQQAEITTMNELLKQL